MFWINQDLKESELCQYETIKKNTPQNLEKSELNTVLKNVFPSERVSSIQLQAKIFELEACFNGHIELIWN